MWLEALIYLPLVLTFELQGSYNTERSEDLATFAANIVENECKNCKTIMVIHSGNEISCDVFFSKVHSPSSMYTVLIDGNGTDISENKTIELLYYPELTIIFLNTELISAEAVIFSVELLEIWNIRGKFLLLSDADNIEDEDEFNNWLQETFESFWYRQALKVLVSIWKSKDEIESYTYDPFKQDYKILVNKKYRKNNWFGRLVKNMYGEPIKLYQFDTVLSQAAIPKTLPDGAVTWVGPDGMFFSVFAQTMNTTIHSHRISEDFDEDMIRDADPSLPFSQYFKIFSDMFDFDLLFNRMQTFSDNTLDHIFLYERNELQIMIPKAGMVPQYLYMMLLVSGDVWAAILVSLISVATIRTILEGKKSLPVLDNLAYLLGTTAHHRKRMKTTEKIVLATWSLSCVVLVTLFQTNLMSTFVVPKYYSNIDSLEELAEKEILVYGPEYTNIQIERILNNNKVMAHVRNVPRNVTIYGDNVNWIDDYKHDYGIILTREQVYLLQKTDPELFKTNHLMAESTMPFAVSYNIPRNKLYFEEVQRIFGTIQEAGLHFHWRSYDYNLERNFTKRKIESKDNNQTLTLFHLQSAFLALIFCLNISLFVFCLEIAWYRTIKKN